MLRTLVIALAGCGASPEIAAVDEPAALEVPKAEPTTLAFVAPPARIAVGLEVTLEVAQGGAGSPGDLTWESSDPAVLEVRAGVARGVAPGVAYVTATADGVQAMVEIAVE